MEVLVAQRLDEKEYEKKKAESLKLKKNDQI
jgi:hypothetical protein